MNFDKLPNVVIIGAAKAGTTSLFEILRQHPQIYTPHKKELRFFSFDKHYHEGIDWYENSYFANASKYPVRIEATPAYLTWSQKVAPRIKELYCDRPIKFIVIFRDPVKRAYSHYWHRIRLGSEDPSISFEKAVHTEDQRLKEKWDLLYYQGNGIHGYLRASHYMERLKPFLDLFPRESFHFMIQEDLYIDYDKRMKDLLEFLGVDSSIALKSIQSNESAVPRYQFLDNQFNKIKKGKIKTILRFFFPKHARKAVVKDFLMKPFEYPPIDPTLKKELYELFENEVNQLTTLIGRDLSAWKYKG